MRGHKVTVITPVVFKDFDTVNLTLVDLGYTLKTTPSASKGFSSSASSFQKASFAFNLCNNNYERQLHDEKFQQLLSNTREYDLLLVQAFCPIAFVLPAKLKLPVVGKLNITKMTGSHTAASCSNLRLSFVGHLTNGQ